MQAIGQAEQRCVLARVALIEYVGNIDDDIADQRAGSLQLRIVRDVCGTRLLDARVLGIGEFGRLGP